MSLTFALILTILFTHSVVARAGKTPASKQAWQYKWWVWMPANWQALGACETGYGKRPGNFNHHNSSYVSAFGIQRGAFNGAYDSDARKVGMPPWNDAHPPTPWQQYQTALSHYRSFGDGWGCPGP